MFTASYSVADVQSLLQLRYVVWIAAGYATYVLFYCAVVYPRFFSPLRNVPGPSMGNPLFGQLFAILKNEPCISQRGWANKYGPVVRYMAQVGQECLIFLHPEALEKILVKDWVEYPRPKFVREILGMVVGNGLFTMTGGAHKQLRKAMNPAFSISNLITQTDMYYEPIEGLVEILKGQIKGEADPEAGKVLQMHRWMGEVTLDIICDTAFGYKLDCLHNPSNELAVAFEQLLSLQSGEALAYLVAAISIPGVARLLASDWLYRHRTLVGKIPTLRTVELLVDSMHRIRKISREILRAKTADLNVPPDDVSTKQDILSLLVRAQKAELDANPVAEAMRDMTMVENMCSLF